MTTDKGEEDVLSVVKTVAGKRTSWKRPCQGRAVTDRWLPSGGACVDS